MVKDFKGSAGKPNQLPRTNASSKLGKGRRKAKDSAGHGSQRSAETITRLKMYTNGKAIRNKKGDVVAGTFMMGNRAGDRTITSETGRIQPDRRWFGNTRTVSATDIDTFRNKMTETISDPYSIVLKRKKLPMGLLQDVAEYSTGKAAKAAILEQEPFEHTFGSKVRRKRVKVDQLFMSRTMESISAKKQKVSANTGHAETLASKGKEEEHEDEDDELNSKRNNDDYKGYEMLLQSAKISQSTYEQVNTQEGIVPWGRDHNITRTDGEGIDWKYERKDDLFLKGQSKRIWGEFFKVVDCSDVVLHVIDARNVPGTRCTMIERHITEKAKHKHLIFVLNKIDLVPNWVVKRWMGELAKDRPTIAFHASLTHAFGKGALISLLRQFGKLHEDKKQISVGVIGYPNVGKSSVINTLISKKSCKVAPIPGETKIWQYISLSKRISLIDCPGVVVDTAGDTETDSVLKGVVRAERLENPQDFIDAILEKVKREHIAGQYKLPAKGDSTWTDSTSLLEMIARRCGRLLKGGDPCLRTAAIMIINDYQRGRLPHYVAPPELKSESTLAADSSAANDAIGDQQTTVLSTSNVVQHISQNLDKVGFEAMKSNDNDDEEDDDDAAGSDDIDDVEKSDLEEKKPPSRGSNMMAVHTSEALIGDGEWDD